MQDRDIQQLNRHFLMVAQRLAVGNLDLACHITGLSTHAMNSLTKMSISEIDEFADVNVLLFAPRIPEQALLTLLSMPTQAKGAYVNSMLLIGEPRGGKQ